MLAGCKDTQEQMLEGTWHAVKLDNPSMEGFFVKSQQYIDTIGKGHSDAENILIYGVSNMDSVRQSMQLQFDSAKKMQDDAIVKTVFTFKKGGIAVITMAGGTDSCKWLLDRDNGLILEDLAAGNQAAVSRYHIVELNREQLLLRFFEEGDSSTVTFSRGAR